MAIARSVCSPTRYSELLGAVLSGEAAPTCPVSFWMHHPGRDQDARSLADATCEFQRTFDLDFAKLTPASSYQLIDCGARDRLAEDAVGRRVVVDRVVSHPEDWLKLRPQRTPGEFAGKIVAAAVLVRQRLPRSVPVVATVFNPLFQAIALAGVETLHLHAKERPDLLHYGLCVLASNTCTLIRFYRDAGVDGIFLASQHATRSALDWETYVKWGLPGDAACLGAAHGILSFYHLHGDAIFANLSRLVCPSVLHYDTSPGNPSADAWLAEGRMGVATGIDSSMAYLDTEPGHAIARIGVRLDRWKGPGFILTSGCALPLDTPPSVLHTIVGAAREVRRGHPYRG